MLRIMGARAMIFKGLIEGRPGKTSSPHTLTQPSIRSPRIRACERPDALGQAKRDALEVVNIRGRPHTPP